MDHVSSRCHRGAAVSLYHRDQPELFSRYETLSELEAESAQETKAVELLLQIANRWAAGSYSHYGSKADLSFAKISFAAQPPWPAPADLANPMIQADDLSHSGFAEGLTFDALDELQLRGFE